MCLHHKATRRSRVRKCSAERLWVKGQVLVMDSQVKEISDFGETQLSKFWLDFSIPPESKTSK